MTDEELLKEMEKRAEAYHDKIKRDFAIEELNKLKAEIHDIKLELDCDYYTGDKITRLIEKHIAELKGEQE